MLEISEHSAGSAIHFDFSYGNGEVVLPHCMSSPYISEEARETAVQLGVSTQLIHSPLMTRYPFSWPLTLSRLHCFHPILSWNSKDAAAAPLFVLALKTLEGASKGLSGAFKVLSVTSIRQHGCAHMCVQPKAKRGDVNYGWFIDLLENIEKCFKATLESMTVRIMMIGTIPLWSFYILCAVCIWQLECAPARSHVSATKGKKRRCELRMSHWSAWEHWKTL